MNGRPRLTTPHEDAEQSALFQWAALHTGQEPRLALLLCIPNGEYRPKGTAGRLQALGVRPGVPDVFLPCPVRHVAVDSASWSGWYGCFLELKRVTGGTVAVEQAWWQQELLAQGYYAAVVRGWVEAATRLGWYLKREDLCRDL